MGGGLRKSRMPQNGFEFQLTDVFIRTGFRPRNATANKPLNWGRFLRQPRYVTTQTAKSCNEYVKSCRGVLNFLLPPERDLQVASTFATLRVGEFSTRGARFTLKRAEARGPFSGTRPSGRFNFRNVEGGGILHPRSTVHAEAG